MSIHEMLLHKLEELAETTGRKEWCQLIERLRTLTEQSPLEEVLPVYRDIREAGILPESTTFFLVLHRIERVMCPMVDEEADQAGEEYRDRKLDLETLIRATIREYTSRHPLPTEYVRELLEDMLEDKIEVGSLAPSMSDIQTQAEHRIVPEQLRLLGEPGMAELFETDRIQFERTREQGRQFFYGPETDPMALKFKRAEGIID